MRPSAAGASTAPPKTYPYMMGRPGGQSGQRGLAEMAHEQLNAGRSRDKLADSVRDAGKMDCFGKESGTAFGLLALPIGAVQAIRDKCK